VIPGGLVLLVLVIGVDQPAAPTRAASSCMIAAIVPFIIIKCGALDDALLASEAARGGRGLATIRRSKSPYSFMMPSAAPPPQTPSYPRQYCRCVGKRLQ
jgi:hypothetical protein